VSGCTFDRVAALPGDASIPATHVAAAGRQLTQRGAHNAGRLYIVIAPKRRFGEKILKKNAKKAGQKFVPMEEVKSGLSYSSYYTSCNESEESGESGEGFK
jgi:hypothetical protein